MYRHGSICGYSHASVVPTEATGARWPEVIVTGR